MPQRRIRCAADGARAESSNGFVDAADFGGVLAFFRTAFEMDGAQQFKLRIHHLNPCRAKPVHFDFAVKDE